MAKITLPDVSNILGNPTSAQNTINGNNDRIEQAFENTLSRDGSTPNQMLSDLDLNNNDILNVGIVDTERLILDGKEFKGLDPADMEAVRDVADAIKDGTLSNVVSQGNVPIYATINGMSSVSVPLAITAIRINGRSSVGDGFGGLFIDINNGSSEKFTSADGRTWYRVTDVSRARLDSRLSRAISVTPEEFGAVGNGVVSDSNAIQTALTVLHDIGGGELLLTQTYLITERLSLGANTTVRCGPLARVVRGHSGGFLSNDLGIGNDIGGYNGHGNVSIHGGTWDGNSVAFYTGFNAFEIGYADTFTLEGATILDVVDAHALDIGACKHVKIRGNKFLGFSNTVTGPMGDRFFSEAVQLDSCTPASFSFGARDRTECYDFEVVGNYFGKNPKQTDPRFAAWPTGVGAHGAVHDRFNSKIKIHGNVFEGSTYAGVRPFKWRGVTIFGNNFVGCTQGILVGMTAGGSASSVDANGTQTNLPQAGSDITISGNTFESTISGDIVLQALVPLAPTNVVAKHGGVVISANTIRGIGASSTGAGIDIRWGDDVVVSDNVIRDKQRGIYARFCSDLVLRGNNIRRTVFEGILINETSETALAGLNHSTGLTIQGNLTRDIAYTGISVVAAVRDINIVGNNLVDISTLASTRYGISLTSGAGPAYLAGNSISKRDASNVNTPLAGIIATSAATDVVIGDNQSIGITDPVICNAVGISLGRLFGATSPAGRVAAPVGSTYIVTTGGTSQTFFVKETGGGGTSGWVAK